MSRIEIKKIQKIKEYRDFLPPLTKEERINLKADIKENGVRDKVILRKGSTMLLDGYNRVDICKELGIKEIDYVVKDVDDPKQWILKNQLSRRNLTELQRDKLIAQAVKKGVEKEQVAKAAKVSPSTVGRIVKQQEEIESLPTHVKEKVAEAGTRRGANEILKETKPEDPRRKLKNDMLDYRSLLIGVLDGAMNLEEDGLKGITAKVKGFLNETKLEAVVDYLETEVKKLKAEMKDSSSEHTLETTKAPKLK